MVAMVFHGSPALLAETEATIYGTVEIPCDPSRIREVALVYIRPVSGEGMTTVVVDPSTGEFRGSGFTAGEYEFVVIGEDGQPLVPEPTKLTVAEGMNSVILTMEPPGCGEEGTDPAAGEGQPGKKQGLKDWQLTLIYVGVVGAVIFALSQDDDDERPASPSGP
jgi:hypothetical protein